MRDTEWVPLSMLHFGLEDPEMKAIGYDSAMGYVVRTALLSALGVCSGCAKPPRAPLTSVVPIIGLPPIQIDTTRPGLDVRTLPSAELIASTERTIRIAPEIEATMLERRPVSMGYPQELRDQHPAGHVLFRVIVGTDGVIQGLSLLETSNTAFIRIAMASVQSWQYRPYLLNGRAIAVDTMVRVDFSGR